jgi:hypothetical protein
MMRMMVVLLCPLMFESVVIVALVVALSGKD